MAKQDDGYTRPSKSDDKAATKLQAEKSEVRKWIKRIENSESYRKTVSDWYRWRQLIEEYRGNYFALQQSTDIYVPMINLIYAYVKSEIPALYNQNPKIKVNPKKGSTVQSAKILEKAVNYLWRQKRIKRENKKNLLDVELVGHTWFKTGYTGNFGAVEDENGDNFEFITNQDFFAYRIPYENITFNPDSNDPPFDCSWIAHQVWVPKASLEQNKEYKHINSLSGQTKEETSQNKAGVLDKNRYDSDVEMICLYEIWDKANQKVYLLSKQCDQWISEPKDWPYEMRGFPFSFLRINDDPECPYGIPDCFMFEPHVIEIMKLIAMKLDHVKRFNRQLIARKGALSDESKANFMKGVTGSVLEADISSNESISNVITPIPYPEIQTDIYQLENSLKEYLVLVGGKPYNEFGGTQETTTRTVKELLEIKKGATDRRAEKVDSVDNFVGDIAYNLIALLQQFADLPYYIRIVGEEEMVPDVEGRPSAGQPDAITEPTGFTFTKEDIQGEFDIEVVPGSTVPMDSNNRVQLLMQILQMLPTLGAQPGGPVMQTVAKNLAEEFDLPEILEAIKEEGKMVSEQQAAAQQKQDQMMQTQIGLNAAEIQIKAEREANKQNKTTLDWITTLRGEGKDAPQQ